MTILLNNKKIEAKEGETIIEAARRAMIEIPSLCYAKGAKHKASCMVCAVKDCKSGIIIPSCTTLPVDGMTLDADCDEVLQTRTMSLELLLSDHRADCEAPCTLVCPNGLDVEQMLACYDNGDYAKAFRLINSAFSLPEIKCITCKAPCEKACRRGTVDKPVAIRAIIEEICSQQHIDNINTTDSQTVKPQFLSRLGRFTDAEKAYLKATVTTSSRCLHCACAGQQGCKLRFYAAAAGIKRPRYESSSATRVMEKQAIGNGLWFEPAKCIRCGLCVYNTTNGFTFSGRGYNMQIVLPAENAANIPVSIAELCPTGAIYMEGMQ